MRRTGIPRERPTNAAAWPCAERQRRMVHRLKNDVKKKTTLLTRWNYELHTKEFGRQAIKISPRSACLLNVAEGEGMRMKGGQKWLRMKTGTILAPVRSKNLIASNFHWAANKMFEI